MQSFIRIELERERERQTQKVFSYTKKNNLGFQVSNLF